ncbi:MAG: hypothetical protein M1838_000842 [Thelocarpon superellum]|nr:MAG: hypothetical protein M1838_000842 [Thelocarpon superellum]
MVTGVETAGLVLAAFPLIMGALDHYQEGYEFIDDWWNFRTTFLRFSNDIRVQKVLWEGNLEELLSPVAWPEEQKDELLRNSRSDGWRDPALDKALRNRYANAYDPFRIIIDDIHQKLEALTERLGIKDGKPTGAGFTVSGEADGAGDGGEVRHDQYTVTGSTGTKIGRLNVAYELRRLKFMIYKGKLQRILHDLTTRNEELEKLLRKNERLFPTRSRRTTPQAFRRIRDQAASFYEVLRLRWRCTCSRVEPQHRADLLLEKRMGDAVRRTTPPGDRSDAHLRVLFSLSTDEQTMDWNGHATEIRIVEEALEHPARVASNTDSSSSMALSDASSATTSRWGRRRPRQVAFQDPPTERQGDAGPAHVTEPSVEIYDLCSVLQSAPVGHRSTPSSLGYLRDLQDQNRRHAIYHTSHGATARNYRDTVTLEHLLHPARHRENPSATPRDEFVLTRRDRYAIAVTLAASLLQLYRTPWMDVTWSKRDIHFLRASEGSSRPIILERPYLSRRFVSHAPPSTAAACDGHQASQECRKSLRSLGIMLLELCYGVPVESHSARPRYLGPDGAPNDMTDYCTAQYWLDQDGVSEAGPEYYEVIRRCLNCSFGPWGTNLGDGDFQSAVYSEVVEQLEKVYRPLK